MCNSCETGDNPAVGHATGPSNMGQLALELIVPPSSNVEMYAEKSLLRKMCHHQRTCH